MFGRDEKIRAEMDKALSDVRAQYIDEINDIRERAAKAEKDAGEARSYVEKTLKDAEEILGEMAAVREENKAILKALQESPAGIEALAAIEIDRLKDMLEEQDDRLRKIEKLISERSEDGIRYIPPAESEASVM